MKQYVSNSFMNSVDIVNKSAFNNALQGIGLTAPLFEGLNFNEQ